MKLHEIKGGKRDGKGKKTLMVDLRNYGEVKLNVEFYYEAPQKTRHGDNASFDEDHPEQYTVQKVTLAEPLEDEDEGKTWPKGTDVDELPGWNERKDTDTILDLLYGEN